MSLRLSIKRPLWADIIAFPGAIGSVSYLLADGSEIVRLRNSEDPEMYVYTARNALELIKTFEGDGDDASIQAWGLIGINIFLDTYTFDTGVEFPANDVEYLFIKTVTGEVTSHYVVACYTESCW